MSELSHQGAFRLIYKRRRTEAESRALQSHLQHCSECRQDAEMAGLFNGHLVLKSLPTRPSPKFAAVYREQAARRSRRSHIMKPIYAVGGLAALALLMLAGWFIIRSNVQTSGLLEAPELPAISVSESQKPAAPEEAMSQPKLDLAAANEQLIAAVEAGDAAGVKQLLNSGADPDFIAGNGVVPLPQAAGAGQLEIVQLLLEAGADVNSTMDGKISTGNTVFEASPLFHAAAAGHLDVVELLLAKGADPNKTEKAVGVAPLHESARMNYVEIVQALLANGADVNLRGTRGDTPLQWATLPGNVEASEVLLEAGADVNNQDLEQGVTPLLQTLMYPPMGPPELINLLLDHGANPDVQDKFGNTALHYATSAENGDIVEILLAGGASIDLQNNGGSTALHRASVGNRMEVVKILIEHGASLDIEDNEGRKALDVAANEQIADMLREAGAVEGSRAETASIDEQLIEAVANKDAVLVNQLLNAGADPNTLDNEGDALLPLAAKDGQLEIVQHLLDAGADINGTHSNNNAEEGTALLWAAVRDHVDVVRLLIANGADLDRPETQYNRSPLFGAAWYNNVEVVELLLESGADPNFHSNWGNGQTPLHYAVSNSSQEAVQALVEGGADLDSQTDGGTTPLMMASTREILTILLDGGANPAIQDNKGNTALHRATLANNDQFTSILIEYGADVGIENLEGQTALDLATDDKVIETLREAGAGE